MTILGWDIGGVNTKAAAVSCAAGGAVTYRTASIPFELQRDRNGLVPVLHRLAHLLGSADTHAITMTAELSQAFRTKREGVGFVLDALEEAFPGAELWVYTTAGHFVRPAEAREIPLVVGASNWMATATLVSRATPTCLLIDIGSTSTDIIPIVDGHVVASGLTDPERLMSGELVYAGAVRTPAEALVQGLAAEGFALTGDAHLWLGRLAADDYTAPTPDGRPATREFAGERLARVVCGDREMFDDAAIDDIAFQIAKAQIHAVVAGIARVRARHPLSLAVVTGLGDFIAAEAALVLGLEVAWLSDRLGEAARVAPAAAVATLLGEDGCRSSSSR